MQAQEKKLDDINDGIYYSIFYKFIFCLILYVHSEAFHTEKPHAFVWSFPSTLL